MTRLFTFGLAVVAVVAVAVVGHELWADDPKTAQPARSLEIGKTLAGELAGERKSIWNNTGTGVAYQAEIPISLKAGQSVSISASVTGKDRNVGLLLADPTGMELMRTSGRDVKSAKLLHEEVPSTGKYTILVFSNLTGPFEVRATESEEASENEPAAEDVHSNSDLEKRVKQLEEEVANLKAAIDALKKSRR